FPGRLTQSAIEQTHMGVAVQPLASVIVGGVNRLLWLILGVSVFVLLAVCVNVACLFLVRGEGRRRTWTIQRFLGAPTGTVLMEFLSEIGVLTCVGAIGGLGIAVGAARAIPPGSPVLALPTPAGLQVDHVLGAATALAGGGISITIAAFTAWRLRGSASDPLSVGSGSTATRAQQRTRYAVVALQVALATVLVAATGLMVRS